MANTVAKGQVDLEVNKDQVTKDISGLGGQLGGAFGKLGDMAGSFLGGGIGDSLKKVVSAMPGGPLGAVVAGIGAGTVAAGVALYGLGKEFDTAYKQIQKQTGATGKEFEALQVSFKNVAKNTGASFTDIATAVGTVAQRTGATGKELDSLSLSMLRMSSITGKDLNTVLESSTKLFNNWKIPVAEMPAAMDKLYVASAKTGVGVDQLSSSAQQFGPVLRQMGFGFEESIALLASFDKAGVNTSKVTGAMGIALGNLAKAGEKDLPGAFAKTIDSINQAGTQAEANSIAVELFGKKAGPQMAEAIRAGAFSVGDLTSALGSADGALANTAKETATFSGKMAKFRNQVKVALEPAAMGLFDSITDALVLIMPYLAKFAEGLGKVIGFLTQNKTVFFIVGGAATAMAVAFGVLTVATILSTTAFGAMAVAVIAATWPVLAIIAAIALLAIGFTLLWQKVDWFRNGLTAAFNWIKSNWPLLVVVLLLPIAPLVALGVAVFKFRDQIVSVFKTVIGAITGFVAAVASGVGAVIGFFTSLPGRVLGAIASLPGALGGAAAAAMGSFASSIASGIGTAVSHVAGIPGKIVAALGDMGRLLFDAGAKVIGGLVDGIKSKVAAVGDAIGGVASTIRGALPFSPAKWGPLSGRGDPHFAGQKIATYLAEGMGQGTSAVAAAAARMAGAVGLGIDVPGATGAAAAGARGGNVYELNMTVTKADVADLQAGFRRLELMAG